MEKIYFYLYDGYSVQKIYKVISKLKGTMSIDVMGVIADSDDIKDVVRDEFEIFPESALLESAYDWVIVTGNVVDFSGIVRRFPSCVQNKLLPDRTVLIPGFTIEKYIELRKSNLTIFSKNCCGGAIYNRLGFQFKSPLINMFIRDEDEYLKFLESPLEYMKNELIFCKTEYEPALKENYPVFLLGDIHLNMNHYGSLGADLAKKIWQKRMLRINYDNVLVIDATTDVKVAERFDKLPWKKICFTSFPTNLKSCFYLDELQGKEQIELERFMLRFGKGDVDVVDLWELLLHGNIKRI